MRVPGGPGPSAPPRGDGPLLEKRIAGLPLGWPVSSSGGRTGPARLQGDGAQPTLGAAPHHASQGWGHARVRGLNTCPPKSKQRGAVSGASLWRQTRRRCGGRRLHLTPLHGSIGQPGSQDMEETLTVYRGEKDAPWEKMRSWLNLNPFSNFPRVSTPPLFYSRLSVMPFQKVPLSFS